MPGADLEEYNRKESERKALEAQARAADTLESDEDEEEGGCQSGRWIERRGEKESESGRECV